MFEIYFHGWGWLDKSIIMLISAPVGFELGLGAELGKNQNKPKSESKLNKSPASRSTQTNKPLPNVKLKGKNDEEISYRIDPATFPSQIK